MNIENLLDIISDPDLLPQRKKHYGIFYGRVLDIHDPMQLGRIRVMTPHYYGMPIEGIPWASYSSPGNGGSKNVGFYFLPILGSIVTVSFIGGDLEFPVWFGGVPGSPDGESDAYVSSLDPKAPYGDPVLSWDFTRVNSITTPSGNRILLDDYRYDSSVPFQTNTRRIEIVEAKGHYLKIIECVDPSDLDSKARIELATVRDDNSKIRFLNLDDEDQSITISGPDSSDSDTHEIRIDTLEDFIRIKSSNNYQFILDDGNNISKWSMTRQGTDEEGFRIVFDNSLKQAQFKSIDDRFGFIVKDTAAGYWSFVSPFTTSESIEAAIVIDRSLYGPMGGRATIGIVSGEDRMGSNGIFIDPGFSAGSQSRPQSVTIFGSGGLSSTFPQSPSSVIRLISKSKGSNMPDGQILLGQTDGSNTIVMTPTASKIEVTSSGQLNVLSHTYNLNCDTYNLNSTNANISASSLLLNSFQIIMSGPRVHDYFQHYHEVDLSIPPNIGAWYVQVGPTPIPVQQVATPVITGVPK